MCLFYIKNKSHRPCYHCVNFFHYMGSFFSIIHFVTTENTLHILSLSNTFCSTCICLWQDTFHTVHNFTRPYIKDSWGHLLCHLLCNLTLQVMLYLHTSSPQITFSKVVKNQSQNLFACHSFFWCKTWTCHYTFSRTAQGTFSPPEPNHHINWHIEVNTQYKNDSQIHVETI